MAITEMLGWKAMAEVNGTLRRVEFDDESRQLTIHGVREDEALDLLNKLRKGAVVGVTPGVVRQASAGLGSDKPGAVREPPPAAKPPPEKMSEKPALAPSAPKAEPAPAPSPGVVGQGGSGSPSAGLLVSGSGATKAAIPEKVLKSGRFIDVMQWVMQTYNLKAAQKDEIIAACREVQQDIPLLGKISAESLVVKVESNLAAFAENGAS